MSLLINVHESRLFWAVALIASWQLCLCQALPAQQSGVLKDLVFEEVARDLLRPAGITHAGDGSGRLYYGGGWDNGAINELVWGFEHKHLGRFQYTRIVDKGLYGGFPDIIAQMLLYGSALGWDACMAVIMSQDASGIRTEYTRASKERKEKLAANLGYNPKLMVFGIDLRPLYKTLLPALEARAQWFIDWKRDDGDPLSVQIEAAPSKVNPKAFPWGWSEYVSRAMRDGQSGFAAPPTPLVRDWVAM